VAVRERPGPVYEVSFFVAPEIAAAFDSWLEQKARAATATAGVSDCRVFAGGGASRPQRTCQYLFADDSALDDFLDADGGAIEADANATFGADVDSQSRILREDRESDLAGAASADCLNCGTRLRGQYCGQCGQRSRSRLISLWELVSDAFGDLFELDSRLWQTLGPLVFRPGSLTHDYLQGRRARYMPPFRMYLVLSVVFFLVAFFDPREQLSLLFEEPVATDTDAGAEAGQEAQDAAADVADGELPDTVLNAQREIIDELVREGVIDREELPEDMFDESGSLKFQIGADADNMVRCNINQSDVDDLPDWLAKRLTLERMQRICERTQIDNGRMLLNELLDNIPAALIVLLPLMALVLKALYPLSRRYYVEHLLFFVHFHAFFFLILTLQVVFARFGALAGLSEAVVALALVVASLYIPVYLFVAMRKVYGQGRLITSVKYFALVTSYIFGFTAMLLGALAISAFSI
jgi:hypothetical protein